MQQLAQYLDTRRELVEAALSRCLPHAPAVLDRALRYSLLGGGKRLRPLLALAAAEAVAPTNNEARNNEATNTAATNNQAAESESLDTEALRLAMPAACALEMIHTYSLIHDDLPAMDDDSLRRGQPTSHVRFGEGMAILAGDGLLTEAFALLAREPVAEDDDIASRKLQTIGLIAEAAGACGMVGGQAIDLHAARPHTYPALSESTPPAAAFDEESLRDMHARKTGALIRAAAVAGAVMAGASDTQRAAIAAYATDLGLAFQIVDDVLDVEGTNEALGKTAGKDAAAGKPTYPALFGLDTSKRLAREAAARACAALADARISGRLPDIASWVVERTN